MGMFDYLQSLADSPQSPTTAFLLGGTGGVLPYMQASDRPTSPWAALAAFAGGAGSGLRQQRQDALTSMRTAGQIQGQQLQNQYYPQIQEEDLTTKRTQNEAARLELENAKWWQNNFGVGTGKTAPALGASLPLPAGPGAAASGGTTAGGQGGGLTFAQVARELENPGDDPAQGNINPTGGKPSSAVGNGQVIESTWREQINRHAPGIARMYEGNDAGLLALRGDPELSDLVTNGYARDNGASLSAAGHPTDMASLYLAHHFGPEGAKKILGADPSTQMKELIVPGTLRANGIDPAQTAGAYLLQNQGAVRNAYAKALDRQARARLAQSQAAPPAPPPIAGPLAGVLQSAIANGGQPGGQPGGAPGGPPGGPPQVLAATNPPPATPPPAQVPTLPPPAAQAGAGYAPPQGGPQATPAQPGGPQATPVSAAMPETGVGPGLVPPKFDTGTLQNMLQAAMSRKGLEGRVAQIQELIKQNASGVYWGIDNQWHYDPRIGAIKSQVAQDEALGQTRGQQIAKRELPELEPVQKFIQAANALPPNHPDRKLYDAAIYKALGGELTARSKGYTRDPIDGTWTYHPDYPTGVAPGVGPGGSAGLIPGVGEGISQAHEAQQIGANRAAAGIDTGTGRTVLPTQPTQPALPPAADQAIRNATGMTVPAPGPGAPAPAPAAPAPAPAVPEGTDYPPPPNWGAAADGSKVSKLNRFEEERYQQDADRYKEMQAGTQADEAMKLNLHQLNEALDNGLVTGKGAELAATITNLAEKWGLSGYVPKGLGNASDPAEFVKVASQLAAEMAKRSGNSTDAQLANALKSNPGLELPMAANRRIIASLLAQVEWRIGMRDAAANYGTKYGSLGGGAFEREYARRHPLISAYQVLENEATKAGKSISEMPQGAVRSATGPGGKKIYFYPDDKGGGEWR